MKIGVDCISSFLALASFASPKLSRSARLGDFQVTVTGLVLNPGKADGLNASTKPGYHYVLVRASVKNVTRYESCGDVSGELIVDRGYHYRINGEPGMPVPTMGGWHLEPGDEFNGAYAFQIKDGTAPVALMLEQDEYERLYCIPLSGKGPFHDGGLKRAEIPLRQFQSNPQPPTHALNR